VFSFVFVLPVAASGPIPLEQECELLTRLFRDEASRGSATFDCLLVTPDTRSDAARQMAEMLGERFRGRRDRGRVDVSTAASRAEVGRFCAERARRSLCHCLTFSATPPDIQAPSVAFTPVILDGPAPRVGVSLTPSIATESDSPDEQWCAVLRQLLSQLI
jgi:hypothetical protein